MSKPDRAVVDAIAFRGDVITRPLDQVTLRCTSCGARAVVKNPQPNTNYRACNCGGGLELIDYRATDPNGRVIGPRGNELPKPWDTEEKPMPDRAVVDDGAIRTLLRMAYESGCDKCGGEMVLWNDIGDMRCQACGRTGDAIESDLRKAQPRALVALSEDRQWLVVYSTKGEAGFDIYTYWEDRWRFRYEPVNWPRIPDTGQDAHEVLREWLDGQNAVVDVIEVGP